MIPKNVNVESVTRRDAYLGVWGIAFISLALTTNIRSSWVWLLVFFSAGVWAVMSAVFRSSTMYVAAFTALAGVAALRSGYSFFLMVSQDLVFIANALMWAAVAIAQVVVAGWPLTEEEIDLRDGHGQSVD